MEELLLDSLAATLGFLERSAPGLAAGVLAAEVLVAKGAVEKAAFVGRPFVRLSNLPGECALSFMTAFVSGRAASAMLVSFYRDGRIGRRELYLASLMNAFPVMVRHAYSMVPVLAAVLGKLGLVYFGVLTLAALVQTLVSALAGRLLIRRRAEPGRCGAPAAGARSGRGDLRSVPRRVVRHLAPVLGTMAAATYVTSLLMASGLFERLTGAVRGWAAGLPLSPEEVSIAATMMVSRIAAYTLGANLLAAGAVTPAALIRALLVGSLLSTVTALREIVPYYVGVYGVRDGSRLMALSMALRSSIVLTFILALGVVA